MNIDFIGVAAARCSTTWLHECLQEHPEICVSEKKEVHFFDNDNAFNKGIDHYFKFFKPTAKEKIIGEFTPRYMLYNCAIERIKQFFPDAKLIISLRDPVERAISQYKYFRFNKKKETEKNIKDAMNGDFVEDYIGKSQYYSQLKNIIKVFGHEKILVIYDFNIKDDPKKTIQKIFKFLNVDDSYIPRKLKEKINYSQYGYHDPHYIWAKLNKFQKQTQRKVCGTTYGNDKSPKFLKPIIRNAIIKKKFNKINLILDKKLPSKKNFSLDQNTKKYLFINYFKKDIDKLEELLKVSLTKWRKHYE